MTEGTDTEPAQGQITLHSYSHSSPSMYSTSYTEVSFLKLTLKITWQCVLILSHCPGAFFSGLYRSMMYQRENARTQATNGDKNQGYFHVLLLHI